MKTWKRIALAPPVKIGWRYLTRKVFRAPNGDEQEYYTYEKVDTRHGAVIAITEDKKVVIAEQFRPGPEAVMQELPGGVIDEGEDPQAGVMRELLEETGYTSEQFEFLGLTIKDAYSNATTYFYLALNCRKVADQKLDSGEFVEVKLIDIAKLIANAKTGQMTDPAAVLLAYDNLKQLEGETK
jgi:ADP-ribose pyrophosphatase